LSVVITGDDPIVAKREIEKRKAKKRKLNKIKDEEKKVGLEIPALRAYRQSVPLAFDYAPSESADFVIPFLRKVFSSIAAMLGRETWEPSQIIVDKHDGLRLALDMASTILVKITTFEP
jgi:hypothetical protein